MGANFTQQASTKVAQAISSLETMVNRFNNQTSIHALSTAHTRKSDEKDLNMVVDMLTTKCLEVIQNRHHNSFPIMKLNPLNTFNRTEFNLWVKKMRQYDKYNGHDVTYTDIVDIEELNDDQPQLRTE